jgi:hypothetical protein
MIYVVLVDSRLVVVMCMPRGRRVRGERLAAGGRGSKFEEGFGFSFFFGLVEFIALKVCRSVRAGVGSEIQAKDSFRGEMKVSCRGGWDRMMEFLNVG